MTQPYQNIALILFSRSAKLEAANKCFVTLGKTANNLQASHLLVDRAKEIGSKSGLPFFFIDETLQHGATFGERLYNAMLDVSALGYQKLLVIGNDCPAITPQLLQQAAHQLQNNGLVLGATHCGGAYLIGVDSSKLDLTSFQTIAWHSPKVYAQLVTLDTSVFELPVLREVNHFFDLLDLPASIIYRFLSTFVTSLRASLLIVFQKRNVPFTSNNASHLAGLRAPPLLAA